MAPFTVFSRFCEFGFVVVLFVFLFISGVGHYGITRLLLILKVLTASILIVTSGWIAKFNSRLAEFLLAVPLTTLIALAFNFAEFKDSKVAVEFAQSTLFAIPLSLLFFIPFLFAELLKLSFWGLYSTGIGLLAIGYVIHRLFYRSLGSS